MKIVGAGGYRDGGTTYVSIDKGNNRIVEYQIDYSLPHDGRPRKVGRVYRNESVSEYEIGSEQERRVCDLVLGLSIDMLGNEIVERILSGEDVKVESMTMDYVCSFLSVCQEEVKIK